MALYEVTSERLRLPAHRLAAGGVAGPDAEEGQKVKNDRGSNEQVNYPLSRGEIVYTEKGDTDQLPENVNAFYCFATAEVERYVKLDALAEVEDPSSLGYKGDPRYEGLYGQDDGTDLDDAQGAELRQAEAVAAADTDESSSKEADASTSKEGGDANSGGRAKATKKSS